MRYNYVPGSDAAHEREHQLAVPPSAVTVLRPAFEVPLSTPGLPGGLLALAKLVAPPSPWQARAAFALAQDARGLISSASLRLRHIGDDTRAFAVYTRREGAEGTSSGWEVSSVMVRTMRGPTTVAVAELKALLRGEPYEPPSPRPPVPTIMCPAGCGREVRVKSDGTPYANHRCDTSQRVEGRS